MQGQQQTYRVAVQYAVLAPMGMRRPQARQRAVREDENLAPLVLQQLWVRMGRPITMDMFSNTMMLLA